jgi:hypothetical protein
MRRIGQPITSLPHLLGAVTPFIRHASKCALSVMVLFLSGCVMGIPDANPPVKPPPPCEIPIWVDGQFKGCVSRKEFRKVLGC